MLKRKRIELSYLQFSLKAIPNEWSDRTLQTIYLSWYYFTTNYFSQFLLCTQYESKFFTWYFHYNYLRNVELAENLQVSILVFAQQACQWLHFLWNQTHTTVIDINKKSLYIWLNIIEKYTNPNCKIIIVIWTYSHIFYIMQSRKVSCI